MHPYCLDTLARLLCRRTNHYEHAFTRLLQMADLLGLPNTYYELATAAATAWRNR